MKLSRTARIAALSTLLALTLVACNGDDSVELSTTSSVISGQPTTVESTTTSTPSSGESPTTVLTGQPVGEYEIVARESDTAGETLYIVIPPGAYTDVDIENFIHDLYESGTATFGAEIFDDAAAVEAYRKPEAEQTDADAELIDQHHFASLQNGTTIVFRGPFEDLGQTVIGS